MLPDRVFVHCKGVHYCYNMPIPIKQKYKVKKEGKKMQLTFSSKPLCFPSLSNSNI